VTNFSLLGSQHQKLTPHYFSIRIDHALYLFLYVDDIIVASTSMKYTIALIHKLNYQGSRWSSLFPRHRSEENQGYTLDDTIKIHPWHHVVGKHELMQQCKYSYGTKWKTLSYWWNITGPQGCNPISKCGRRTSVSYTNTTRFILCCQPSLLVFAQSHHNTLGKSEENTQVHQRNMWLWHKIGQIFVHDSQWIFRRKLGKVSQWSTVNRWVCNFSWP
jgi:hypothetical protein